MGVYIVDTDNYKPQSLSNFCLELAEGAESAEEKEKYFAAALAANPDNIDAYWARLEYYSEDDGDGIWGEDVDLDFVMKDVNEIIRLGGETVEIYFQIAYTCLCKYYDNFVFADLRADILNRYCRKSPNSSYLQSGVDYCTQVIPIVGCLCYPIYAMRSYFYYILGNYNGFIQDYIEVARLSTRRLDWEVPVPQTLPKEISWFLSTRLDLEEGPIPYSHLFDYSSLNCRLIDGYVNDRLARLIPQENDKVDYESLIEYFSESIRLKPLYSKSWYYHGRGIVNMALKKFDAAIADYTEALRLYGQEDDPKYTLEHYPYVWSFDYVKDLEIECAEVYQARAKLYETNANYEAALPDYTKAIDLCKKSLDIEYKGNWRVGANDIGIRYSYLSKAYYARAEYYHSIGSQEAALEDYTEAINLLPKYHSENKEKLAQAYQARAAVHQAMGNTEAAEADLAQASEINPQVQ